MGWLADIPAGAWGWIVGVVGFLAVTEWLGALIRKNDKLIDMYWELDKRVVALETQLKEAKRDR